MTESQKQTQSLRREKDHRLQTKQIIIILKLPAALQVPLIVFNVSVVWSAAELKPPLCVYVCACFYACSWAIQH